MANVETYKWSAMKSIIEEATREASHYKNNVDPERTPNNYSLIEGAETREQVVQKVRDRVEEVMGSNIRKQVKANMKPFGCWVIHLPIELNGLSDEEKRDFFETSLDFLRDRYGEENIVMATVHMDEGRPHMHAGIVPVGTSRKTGKQTVSKASVFTMTDLRTFHDDLDAIMAEKYGQAKLIHNERTKGNYTIAELKERQRVQAELDAQRAEIEQVQTELMETVWPAVKQLNRERPQVAEQKAKNEADAKRLAERQKALQEYQQKLIDWRDKQTAVFESRKASLEAREAEVAEREAEVQAKEQEASEKLREASETLEEAKEEAKGIIARAKSRASEMMAQAKDVLRKIPLINKMMIGWAEKQEPEDRQATEEAIDKVAQYGIKEPIEAVVESADEKEQRDNMELLQAVAMLTEDSMDEAKDKAETDELTREDVHDILTSLQDLHDDGWQQ
ncbi:MobV family relaxase [Escherichia coli]|uniref:MobV family relaxase n=1 Tax=Escherichia coli TaxID=562 RepID=UPI000BE3FE5D|nr:MobV family relaxase [Escherichia coli]